MDFIRKKTVVHRLYEAAERYMQGDEHALDHLLSPDLVDRVLGSGREGIFTTLQVIRDGFSEVHFDVHDVVIDGEIMVVHLTMSLLHTKRFMQIPPTHRHIQFTHVAALRVENGLIVERLWCVSDALTMWQQLGVFTFAPLEEASA